MRSNRKLHWIFNRYMAPLDADGNETGGAETPPVDGSSGSGAIGTGNDDRLALLARIAANADAEREDQLQDVNDDDTTAPFVADKINDDGTVSPGTEPAVKEEPKEPAAKEEPAPPVVKHKLKVNGVEKEFTFDEVLALAQKAEAADETFRKAATLRQEAESLTPAKPPVKGAPADDSEELRALARALQVGNEDEAVAALRKLKGSASPPAPPLGDLYQVIDAKLAFNDANRIFREEFADLVSDARLERMIMERDAEVIAAGDKRPYLERYREIGNEVRAWRDTIAPKPATSDSVLTEKEVRKAAAPATPPVASGKAKQAQLDDEPEESASETIAKMGKARGGPQWMRS